MNTVQANLFRFITAAGSEVLHEYAETEDFTAFAETLAEQLALVVNQEDAMFLTQKPPELPS